MVIKTIGQDKQIKTLITPAYKEYWNNKVSAASGILPNLNGQNLSNVRPVTQRIDFVGGVSTSNVVWTDGNTKVTIQHSMNCIPIISVYDGQNNQLNNLNIKILTGNIFQINFLAAQTSSNVYYCIVNYGTEFGDPTAISNQLSQFVNAAETAKQEAQAARTLAQQAATTAVSHSIQLEFKINENEQLIMTKLAGQAFDFNVDSDGNLIFEVSM